MERETLNYLRKEFEEQKRQELNHRTSELNKQLLEMKNNLVGSPEMIKADFEKLKASQNEKLEREMEIFHKNLEKEMFQDYGGSTKVVDERIKELIHDGHHQKQKEAKEHQNQRILDNQKQQEPVSEREKLREQFNHQKGGFDRDR